MSTLTGNGVLRTAGGGLAVVLLTVCLFGAAWLSVFTLVGIAGGPATLAAWGVTGGLVALSVWMGASAGAGLTVRVLAYQLASVFLLIVFLGVVLVATTLLGTLITWHPELGIAMGLVTTAILGAGAVSLFVAGVWGADSADDWALFVRLMAASLALSLLTVFMLSVTWVLSLIVATFMIGLVTGPLGLDATASIYAQTAIVLATVLTGLFVVSVLRSNASVVDAIEQRTDATLVSPDDAPHLHAVVNRMAAQLNIPSPAIAVSESDVPEAMIVGVRPSNMHLVLSAGAIETLDDDELIAVIAHELAHVANRDAAVMTALSTPSILADALRPDLGDDDSDSMTAAGIVAIGVKLFVYVGMSVPWAVAKVIVAALGREREAAADRVAAETLGSPESLVAALRSLDDRIANAAAEDLRAVSDVSSLSILPLDPSIVDESGAKHSGLPRKIFGTHPTTQQRIEQLRELDRKS